MNGMNRTNREEKSKKKKQQHHSVGHVQGSRVANLNKQRIKRISCKKAIDQRFVYLSHHMHSIQKKALLLRRERFFFLSMMSRIQKYYTHTLNVYA